MSQCYISGNPAKFNRQPRRLEMILSHTKQTPAHEINRQLFGTFEMQPEKLAASIQRVAIQLFTNHHSLITNHASQVTNHESRPPLLQSTFLKLLRLPPEAHMAEIQPFRAFRYDTNRVPLDKALTQPYDKITPAMQEKYYAASPYNLIAIEKGLINAADTPENNVYTRAGQKIKEWIKEKVLIQDAAPAIYVYSQEYLVPGTHTRKTRIGFIALGRVEDYDAHIVFRHERTLSAPKADRIELLRHTHAQTGQLFMLYDDAARRIDNLLEEIAKPPAANEMQDEYGVTHRLWPVTDVANIRRIQNAMADKKLIIADGHHRYETALNFAMNRASAKASTIPTPRPNSP